MDGMDIEIPDAEDAACDMGQLSSYFARRGQYEEAAMVDGAARRMRADAAELATLRARVEELEKDRERLEALGRPTVILTTFDSGIYAAIGGETKKYDSIRDVADAARASAGERGE